MSRDNTMRLNLNCLLMGDFNDVKVIVVIYTNI